MGHRLSKIESDDDDDDETSSKMSRSNAERIRPSQNLNVSNLVIFKIKILIKEFVKIGRKWTKTIIYLFSQRFRWNKKQSKK